MKGIPASDGVAIGPVFIWEDKDPVVDKKPIHDTKKALEKLDQAVEDSKNQLKKIQEKARQSLGESEAQVFDAHLLLMEDPEWIGKIQTLIENEKVCSEYIVQKVTNEFVAVFEAMDNEYLKARASDLKDVSGRLIKNILGLATDLSDMGSEPVIIVARDLTPSDTAQLDKEAVLGFITEQGNKTSHSAIIARTMGIPALVGARGLLESLEAIESQNIKLAFDGNTGEIHINPEVDIIRKYNEKIEEEKKMANLNESVRGLKSCSRDGFEVELACNIAKPEEADLVVESDGEGVGLFRSEFLFMDRDQPPSEDEQYLAYKTAVEKLKGRPLIVRTLDAGGDKQIPYLNIDEEMNPFLGYRALRICLDDEELFRPQIRSILRASAHGQVKIMLPMVATMNEFRQAKALVESEKSKLLSDGIRFDPEIELGIMVEIPSVAVLAHKFAKEVDFFSIGTNDLTQYTLAADRMNAKLGKLYNHRNPAVLGLIKMVIDAAEKEGKWVGMCGEAAGDKYMIPILLGMGLKEFSMAPSSILPSRRLIRSLSAKDCKVLANDVLNMNDVEEIEKKMEAFLMQYK